MSDEPSKQETDTAPAAADAAVEGEAPAVESEEAAAPEEESTATFAPVVSRFILPWPLVRDAIGHWPWLHQDCSNSTHIHFHQHCHFVVSIIRSNWRKSRS
jgi:hypothetical protein